jgi:Protein of unknown function (DUF3224)
MIGSGKRGAWLLSLWMFCVPAVYAQQQASTGGGAQSAKAMKHAHGTFDVKLAPQKPDNKEAEAAKIQRMSIDKQFQGDIEGASKGEMLFNSSEVKDSGAYVAIERVTCKIDGRTGSFDLEHLGIMDRGRQQLSIAVIPDSGSGEFQGINGKMMITITNGKHFYDFDYSLPEAAK